MPRSTKLSLFPDVNVWIALTFRGHIHHPAATAWLDALPHDSELYFCRFTQLGFLRLLTTPAVMGNKVLSQAAAWEIFDDWLEHGHSAIIDEPPFIEPVFRSNSQSPQAAPKDWADSYISAFATVSGLQLVTFDRVLQRRTDRAILLTH